MLTYLNKVLKSPHTKATNIGVIKHAGTKYNKAGCAALYTCMTNTVVSNPKRYAKNVALKYVFFLRFKL